MIEAKGASSRILLSKSYICRDVLKLQNEITSRDITLIRKHTNLEPCPHEAPKNLSNVQPEADTFRGQPA